MWARCSGVWTRRISSSVAGRARSCTSWSSTPVTSSRLRNLRFVSGFSKARSGCAQALRVVVAKSFQMPASCHA